MTNPHPLPQAFTSMIPLQGIPIEEMGFDIRPVAEAVAFYLTGYASLEEVRNEVRYLIYGDSDTA